MPHQIHVSERRSFRGCRRRWNWAYREGYSPLTKNKHLDFGIAYHKAKDVFYEPESYSVLSVEERLSRAILAFTNECEDHLEQYLLATEQKEAPQDVEEDFAQRLELGVGMLTYFANNVHPKFDTWFKPVATEIAFSVPLEDPDNPGQPLRCTNSPKCGQSHSNDVDDDDSLVVYSGRVDMIVEDIRYGGYYIWDHKTAAQLAKDDGFLQLDDQIGSYCWALQTQLNIDVRGFIYSEIRKDYPRPPALLKRGQGGRSFSVSKTQPTNLEVFEPFIKEHDPIAYKDGAYSEYLKFLASPDSTLYHQRFIIVKSDAELKNIGETIALEAADMVDSRLRIYPSVGRYSCSTCAFRQPCLATMMDEDAQNLLETNYHLTTRRYWMDQQASSEKSGK